MTKIQQAPIRNTNTIGASVYSHSGEFSPSYTDLQLKGRGLNFQFIRSYRSSQSDHIGELGLGWSSSITKKIERRGEDIIYHNGAGEVYTFFHKTNYTSPDGFYGTLLQGEKYFLLHQRYGITYHFELPEQGGRIKSIEDANQNTIQFSYSDDNIVIVDTLKREINISTKNGMLQELTDHAGRTWKYIYEKNLLIEVVKPATLDFPNGTLVKYAYDKNHKLISITDAKDQKYLVNHYDESERIVAQEHGDGTFQIEYEKMGGDESVIYRTTCVRKNKSKIVLEHNRSGNVLKRTLNVRRTSFSPEDISGIDENDIPLVTISTYNKNSELTSRIFPAGNKTEWIYSKDEMNSLNRGNLLKIIQTPQPGIDSDQERIVIQYEYESEFQFSTKLIDPRGNNTSYEYDKKGNLIVITHPSVTIQPVNDITPRPDPLEKIYKDEYQYNSMGQLLQRKHIDGAITKYYYYSVDDPIGTDGPNTATNSSDKICGYLARIVRDANGKQIINEYAYDNFGNNTVVFDGKGNPARLQYNAMGNIENITSREPFKYQIDYKYDANYNEIESSQLFERLEYDETSKTTTATSSTLRELKEYNVLDNITQRKIIGDDKIITEHFIRDANENIIRQIQPLGNKTEYIYDERNMLIEKKFGVDTQETFSNKLTYTLNGAVRAYTDGKDQITTRHYDGFHRYKGFTNPIGTKKTQWFDESDNVVRVKIDGDKGLPEGVPFMEANYHFDQWNRVYQVDNAWHDYSNGEKLGKSKWNGEKGIVSSVLEYADNGLPGKVWTETNNVVDIEYDGVGRVVKMKDLTGEEFYFEYDENNNPVLLKHLGPKVEGRRSERVLQKSHDEMDRLDWQQENNDTPERFAYNLLGNVIKHVGKSGIETSYIDDSLGRRVGHSFTISDKLDDKVQNITRKFEYDDNYRLIAYTDAAGQRTEYQYNTLDRQTSAVFPDGNNAHVEYDANGNIIRVVDQNNNEINNRFDELNHIVERQSLIKNTGKETTEYFEYDGVNRMVAAITPDATIRRTYDSLSHLLTEQQDNRELQYTHDSSGNLTRLVYPGGEEVHKEYDIKNRVTSVKNRTGESVANFIYRANHQIAKMLLGNVIETDFTYNKQERLEKIEYTKTNDSKLIEGFQYQYDDTGKMIHEIQLSVGPTSGKRYYYDNANRPIKVQYGVKDVFDPNSSFEKETSYEHFPEGSWERRVDNDGQGNTIDDKVGTTNKLNKYQKFGNLYFEYDANGNCTLKGTLNPNYWKYTYDQDNKLVKSEQYDKNDNLLQTIEYFYDSLGRLVRKVVTDENGKRTEFTYVWTGTLLLEEYENGVLVRTYFYGLGKLPVQLSVNNDGESSYYYTHNGRGLASGLVPIVDPNAFAERYSHEITGDFAITEINGVKLSNPFGDKSHHGVSNAVNSTSSLTDWHNLTQFSTGGKHSIPGIGMNLNGFDFGKGQNGVKNTMQNQMNDWMNAIGHGSKHGAGSRGNGKPPGIATGGANPSRNMSLVSDIGSDYVDIATGGGRTEYVTSDAATGGGRTEYVTSDAPLVDTTPSLTPTNPDATNTAGDATNTAGVNTDPPAAPDPNKNDLNKAVDRGWKDKPVQMAIASLIGLGIVFAQTGSVPVVRYTGTFPKMTNPDADTSVTFPTPQDLERRLMWNKRPVNPMDFDSPVIDQSQPPRKSGGIDPHIALYSGDYSGGDYSGGVGTINILYTVGGGFTDPVRPDLAQDSPELGDMTGGPDTE